jgi:hypothetical protein
MDVKRTTTTECMGEIDAAGAIKFFMKEIEADEVLCTRCGYEFIDFEEQS